MKDKVLKQTQSVCPICLKPVVASYIAENRKVWLKKTCAEHNTFKTLVWENKDEFLNWQTENIAQKPVGNDKPFEKGCPYDCGLCTQHIQASCCVLFEVTNRCNLACPTCYASAGNTDQKKDISIDTITHWYDTLLEKGGPFNIQLSGGEPTMRDDLDTIIQLGKEKGFTFFQLNTNGIRIAKDINYLKNLKQSGLSTVFLQFDGTEDTAYQKLRGQNLFECKKQAIINCQIAQVAVVLVPTVHPQHNLSQVGDIVRFAQQYRPTVKGVHFQPISYFGRYDESPQNVHRTTIPLLLHALESQLNQQVKYSDFSAASAEHSLCSFHAEYTIKNGEWILNKKTSSCCCTPATNTSDVTRDAVALKWSLSDPRENKLNIEKSDLYDIDSLDAFLQEKYETSFSISGMAFQDAWNFDMQRIKRCNVHIMNENGDIIPFCAMNLTNQAGKSLYRSKNCVNS